MHKSDFLAVVLAILLPHIVSAVPIPNEWLKLSAQRKVFEVLGISTLATISVSLIAKTLWES